MQSRLAPVLAIALVACAPPRVDLPERRVVLVTLDTLRWDAFASPDSDMPETALWAEGATVFERYYSASPVTQPAHASLMTGLQPWEHGVTRNGLVLDGSRETVTELLADAGWRTGAVVASFPLTRRMGLDQGFGIYVDDFDRAMGDVWNEFPVDRDFYSLAGRVTERALSLLDDLGGPSQFLWVHYFDPHAPYGDASGDEPILYPKLRKAVLLEPESDAAARVALAAARKAYRADVRAFDVELGRLLARLEADAGAGGVETHVVLVSDHGESFGEDGSLGHGKRLTAVQVQVPLVIRSARVQPGVRSDDVGSIDVARTLLDLAGVAASAFGGRVLGEPVEGPVFGMRNTFTGPAVDERTDGTERVLDGPRWFAAERGNLFSGDANGVWSDDDEARPAPQDVAFRLAPLFARFAADAEEARELTDEATRAALTALGYAD